MDVDTENHRLVKRIANVAQVQSVLAIPELGRVHASATGTNEVVAIDEKTLEVTARMPGGTYPDGLACKHKVNESLKTDVIERDRRPRGEATPQVI